MLAEVLFVIGIAFGGASIALTLVHILSKYDARGPLTEAQEIRQSEAVVRVEQPPEPRRVAEEDPRRET